MRAGSDKAVGHLVVAVLLMALFASGALAAPAFPPLTGRVVDNANLIDKARETRLTDMLAAHEQASGEQIVVVTLADLGGETIEDYGYQLGRHWGIGQADEDNGALLIVAQAERAIRIEVGYGLEGRLTDAQSAMIIDRIIRPAFRQGDFGAGLVDGVRAMVQVLGGDPLAESARGEQREAPSLGRSLGFFVLMVAMIALFGSGGGPRGRGRRRRRWGVPIMMGGGFGGSGGGFGGGFSGGGGGFGGGGASGGW